MHNSYTYVDDVIAYILLFIYAKKDYEKISLIKSFFYYFSNRKTEIKLRGKGLVLFMQKHKKMEFKSLGINFMFAKNEHKHKRTYP